MKVFILCNKSPYPPRDGGSLAMNFMVTGLISSGQQVKVLALSTNKFPVNKDTLPVEYLHNTGFESVHIDLSIKPLQVIRNLLSGKSLHVDRFINKNVADKIIEILQNEHFDIIQLETLYMCPYIPVLRKFSTAKIVLRAHNVEHLIWERITRNESNPIKKLYLHHLTRTLKNYEVGILNQVDGIVAITEKDADYFRSLGSRVPVISVPFGIDIKHIPDHSTSVLSEPSLFHIGAMNWIPNIEGIKWFLDKVWPLVHKRFPELKCYLAGRAMPEWLQNATIPGIVIVGEVEDAYEFMYSHTIGIAPLLSGSGIRVKIIEGMAAARAMVSTSIGAEGIEAKHGEHLMIADDPESFYQAIKLLVENPLMARDIGKNARDLVIREYSMPGLMKKMVQFYHQISHAGQ